MNAVQLALIDAQVRRDLTRIDAEIEHECRTGRGVAVADVRRREAIDSALRAAAQLSKGWFDQIIDRRRRLERKGWHF